MLLVLYKGFHSAVESYITVCRSLKARRTKSFSILGLFGLWVCILGLFVLWVRFGFFAELTRKWRRILYYNFTRWSYSCGFFLRRPRPSKGMDLLRKLHALLLGHRVDLHRIIKSTTTRRLTKLLWCLDLLLFHIPMMICQNRYCFCYI